MTLRKWDTCKLRQERRRPRYGLCAVLLAALMPLTGTADELSTRDLKALSVDDLMNIQVTSVARHPEKLLNSASAIQVITQEDIRRSGATSIPEALRLADNLQVAQENSHGWAISARGFNTALANKLLVMIDGRTVYTPLYSGVFWDVQDYLLEDIDRIEVISGPGGTLWGANAVNGVINIITKSAANTQGTYAEAGGGSEPQGFGAARYGGSLGADGRFRVYGKVFSRGDEELANGAPVTDAWRQGRAGFRVDSAPSAADRLTVQGDIYDGHENSPTGGEANVGGDNLLARWTRTLASGADFSLQTYFDQTHLADPIGPLALGAVQLGPAGTLYDDLTTYDVDFQYRPKAGAFNRIIWGLGYRLTRDAVLNTPALGFLPPNEDLNLYSGFIQDEVAVGRDLTLTLGSKLEHNDFTGFEVEPNVRLGWSVASNQVLWGAVSRAVRTPSLIDRDLSEGTPPYLVILKGNPNFESETLIAYELGYRTQISSRFSASVSSFYNRYDDVRSTNFTPVTILPLYFENDLEGHTYGVEFSGNYQLTEQWALHAGYTWLREHMRVMPGAFDLDGALNETADPKGQFSLRSSLNLPLRTELDADLRWVDTLLTNDGPTPGVVPSYFELNARLAWHASKRLEVSVAGENLLHDRHPEYGFPGPARVEIVRSVYAKLAWRY